MIKDNWRGNFKNRIAESKSLEFAILVDIHNLIARATHLFFEKKKLKHIPVPATTVSASSPMGPGSDSSAIAIQIKDRSILLTDSAQFHLEYACRSCRDGCFFYGHSFRDEEPDWRHLSQFTHVEAEIHGKLEDVKILVEDYIRYITRYIWENTDSNLSELPGIENRVFSLLNNVHSFRSISFQEACDMLKSHENALKKCEDGSLCISAIGELILLEKLGEFIWIEHWDRMTVPFYQAFDKEQGWALNADLLFGIGEVAGAGQRHIDSQELEQALHEHGLLTNDYKWYIEMKEKLPLQTSGFGMGVERYLMWLLDLKDIRSVELFPRDRLQFGEV